MWSVEMPPPPSLGRQKSTMSDPRPPSVQACDRCRRRKIRCIMLSGCCKHCSTAGLECRTTKKLKRRILSRVNTDLLKEPADYWALDGTPEWLTSKSHDVSFLPPKKNPAGTQHEYVTTRKRKRDMSGYDELELNPESSSHISETPKECIGSISCYGATLDTTVPPTSEEHVGHRDVPDHSEGPPFTMTTCEPSLPVEDFYESCIRNWFTTWHPLFRILSKQKISHAREHLMANSGDGRVHVNRIQLHLIASIIAQSSSDTDTHESEWRSDLDGMMMDTTMNVLHCIMLALLYSLLRGDGDKCQYYKGVAISQLYRLGLHLDLAPHFFSPIALERRRRTLWAFHILDCFSAASTGLPRLLDDKAVETSGQSKQSWERDDWGISRDALALYHSSIVLARVIKCLYSEGSEHEWTPSYHSRVELDNELNDWRIQMLEPLPSSSSKAVLRLIYHYIRLFIFFPVLDRDQEQEHLSALVLLETSSRHIHSAVRILKTVDVHFPLFLDRNHLVEMCVHVQEHKAIKHGWYPKRWPMTALHVKHTSRTMKPASSVSHDSEELEMPDNEFTEASEPAVQGSTQRGESSEWDVFVGILDRGRNNIHQLIYEGDWLGDK